jgi:hypothetical protein
MNNLLYHLEESKARGADGFPAWLLKQFSYSLAPVVHEIITASTIQIKSLNMLYSGETGRPLRTRTGEHRRAVIGNDLTSLFPDILILAFTVFQISKFEPSDPYLEATIAAKDTWHCPPLWH